jgi:hypothetical protein
MQLLLLGLGLQEPRILVLEPLVFLGFAFRRLASLQPRIVPLADRRKLRVDPRDRRPMPRVLYLCRPLSRRQPAQQQSKDRSPHRL